VSLDLPCSNDHIHLKSLKDRSGTICLSRTVWEDEFDLHLMSCCSVQLIITECIYLTPLFCSEKKNLDVVALPDVCCCQASARSKKKHVELHGFSESTRLQKRNNGCKWDVPLRCRICYIWNPCGINTSNCSTLPLSSLLPPYLICKRSTGSGHVFF
jgi:hypothetical protein